MLPLVKACLVLVFPALVLTAAVKDATTFRIPNWISLALIAGFVPAALAIGLPLPAIGLHLGVGLAALVAGMAMFALRWIGGGDAKLFAAAALWLGWPAALPYLAVTGLAGGGLAVALLGLRSMWLRPYVLGGPAWFARLAEPDEAVPYGLAIAAGALAAFQASPFAAALAGLR
jgi:prepilin peptidase CpaA